MSLNPANILFYCIIPATIGSLALILARSIFFKKKYAYVGERTTTKAFLDILIGICSATIIYSMISEFNVNENYNLYIAGVSFAIGSTGTSFIGMLRNILTLYIKKCNERMKYALTDFVGGLQERNYGTVKEGTAISEELIKEDYRNEKIDNEKCKEKFSSVIGKMVEQEMKVSSYVSGTLVLSAIFYLFADTFQTKYFNWNVFLFIFLMIIFVWLKHWIVYYRIQKGYFGNNEYEIRELIKFIVNDAKYTDLHDGEGPRKLIDPDEFIKKQKFPINVFAPKPISLD